MADAEADVGVSEEIDLEVEIPSEKNADLIMGVREAFPMPLNIHAHIPMDK